jgi:hypothetical protein
MKYLSQTKKKEEEENDEQIWDGRI